MDGFVFFYVLGSVVFVWALAWTIGSIRRNTAKSARSAAISAGTLARAGDITCPKCKEFIKSDAEVCRHCGFAEVQMHPAVIQGNDTRRNEEMYWAIDNIARKRMNRYLYVVSAILFVTLIGSVNPVPAVAWISTGLFAVALVLSVPLWFVLRKKYRADAIEQTIGNNAN